jgi:hypothetical protein
MSDTKLKLCPFCGGEAKFQQFSNPKNFYNAKCTICDCGTDGFKLCRFENKDKENKTANAAAWNRRTEVKKDA